MEAAAKLKSQVFSLPQLELLQQTFLTVVPKGAKHSANDDLTAWVSAEKARVQQLSIQQKPPEGSGEQQLYIEEESDMIVSDDESSGPAASSNPTQPGTTNKNKRLNKTKKQRTDPHQSNINSFFSSSTGASAVQGGGN